MKKILAILLTSALLCTLCACSKEESKNTTPVTTAPIINENVPLPVEANDLMGSWTTEFTWKDIMGPEDDSQTPTLEQAEMMIILDKLNDELFSTATIEFGEYYRGRMYVNEDVTTDFIEKMKSAYVDYYTSSEYIEVMYGMTAEQLEAQFAAEGKTMDDYRQELKADLDEEAAITQLLDVMKDKKYNYDFAYSLLDNQIIITVIDKEMAETGEKLTKTLTLKDNTLVMANDEGDDIIFTKN